MTFSTSGQLQLRQGAKRPQRACRTPRAVRLRLLPPQSPQVAHGAWPLRHRECARRAPCSGHAGIWSGLRCKIVLIELPVILAARRANARAPAQDLRRIERE